MSYHVMQPRRVSRRRAAAPAPVQYYPLSIAGEPPYTLLPLAEATAPTAPARDKTKELLLVIVVIAVIGALMWWLDQQNQKALKPNRSRAKKQSTAAMAKNLYKRLEARGGAHETTMRSLKQLGRKA